MMALSMADLPSDLLIYPRRPQPDGSLFLGLVLKDQLGLELVGAPRDDEFSLLQPGLDDDPIPRVAADVEGAERERMVIGSPVVAALQRDERSGLALDLDHGAMGHR